MSLSQQVQQVEELVRAGEYEQALARYEALIAKGHREPRLWYGFGYCCYKRGELSQARDALEKAEAAGHMDAAKLLQRIADRTDRPPENPAPAQETQEPARRGESEAAPPVAPVDPAASSPKGGKLGALASRVRDDFQAAKRTVSLALELKELENQRRALQQRLTEAYTALGAKAEEVGSALELPAANDVREARQKAERQQEALNTHEGSLEQARAALQSTNEKHGAVVAELEEAYRPLAENLRAAEEEHRILQSRITTAEKTLATCRSNLDQAEKGSESAETLEKQIREAEATRQSAAAALPAAGEKLQKAQQHAAPKADELAKAKGAWEKAKAQHEGVVTQAESERKHAKEALAGALSALKMAQEKLGKAIVESGRQYDGLESETTVVAKTIQEIDGTAAEIADRQRQMQQTKGGAKRFAFVAGCGILAAAVLFMGITSVLRGKSGSRAGYRSEEARYMDEDEEDLDAVGYVSERSNKAAYFINGKSEGFDVQARLGDLGEGEDILEAQGELDIHVITEGNTDIAWAYDPRTSFVALTRRGEVYVSGAQGCRIGVLTGKGHLLHQWRIPQSIQERGMDVDSEGNLYVLGKGSVSKYSIEGELLVQWGANGEKEGTLPASDVTVGPDGHVYILTVADGSSVVHKFTDNGVFKRKFHVPGVYADLREDGYTATPARVGRAGRIAADEEGNLYVKAGGAVFRLSSEGEKLDQWKAGNVMDIAAGGAGTLFGYDHRKRTIRRYSIRGQLTGEWQLGPLKDEQLGYIDATPHNELVAVAALRPPGRKLALQVIKCSVPEESTGLPPGSRAKEFQCDTYSGDPGYVFESRWGGMGTANGQFLAPQGVAADQKGLVYVADSGNDRIQVFTGAGEFRTVWTVPGCKPEGYNRALRSRPGDVAIGSQGDVYVIGERLLVRFGQDGSVLDKWGEDPRHNVPLGIPSGLGATAEARVYMGTGDGIARVQPDRKPQDGEAELPPVRDTGHVWDIVPIGRTEFVVACAKQGLLRVSEYSTKSPEARTPYLTPRHLAVDAEKNVYTVDHHQGYAYKFTAKGKLLAKWGSFGYHDGQLVKPWGIAVDGSGNVYVTDVGRSCVHKFRPAG